MPSGNSLGSRNGALRDMQMSARSGGAAVMGLVSADLLGVTPCILFEQSDLRAERTRYARSGMGGLSRVPSSSRTMMFGHRGRCGRRPACWEYPDLC